MESVPGPRHCGTLQISLDVKHPADVPAGSIPGRGRPLDSAVFIGTCLRRPVFGVDFDRPRTDGAIRPCMSYARSTAVVVGVSEGGNLIKDALETMTVA